MPYRCAIPAASALRLRNVPCNNVLVSARAADSFSCIATLLLQCMGGQRCSARWEESGYRGGWQAVADTRVLPTNRSSFETSDSNLERLIRLNRLWPAVSSVLRMPPPIPPRLDAEVPSSAPAPALDSPPTPSLSTSLARSPTSEESAAVEALSRSARLACRRMRFAVDSLSRGRRAGALPPAPVLARRALW